MKFVPVPCKTYMVIACALGVLIPTKIQI